MKKYQHPYSKELNQILYYILEEGKPIHFEQIEDNNISLNEGLGIEYAGIDMILVFVKTLVEYKFIEISDLEVGEDKEDGYYITKAGIDFLNNGGYSTKIVTEKSEEDVTTMAEVTKYILESSRLFPESNYFETTEDYIASMLSENKDYLSFKHEEDFVRLNLQFKDAEDRALTITAKVISDSDKKEAIRLFTDFITNYNKTLGEMKMELLLPGKKEEIVNLLKFKIQGVENLKGSLLEKIHFLNGLHGSKQEQNSPTLKLSDIFESNSKYEFIMKLLVEKKYCQPETFIWADEKKSNKSTIISIIKYLYKQGYYLKNKKPTSNQIKLIAQNTFGETISESLIKQHKTDENILKFIPIASTIS